MAKKANRTEAILSGGPRDGARGVWVSRPAPPFLVFPVPEWCVYKQQPGGSYEYIGGMDQLPSMNDYSEHVGW